MAIFNQVSPTKSRGGFEDANRQILSGLALPGVSSDTAAAAVGSTYERVGASGGSTWIKKIAGAGTANWTRIADINDLAVQASANSWREPAVTMDTVLTSAASAVTEMNIADTLGGATVAAGDTVLLSGTTAGIYTVGGSTGAWTLTATANAIAAGDNIEIISGTHGRQLWNFDGTSWGWFGQNSSSEEAALRAFVGKSVAGVVATAYTSNFFVTNGDSLEVALGSLDAGLDTVRTTANNAGTTANNAQATANSLIVGTGLAANGTLNAINGTYVTSASTSLRAAVAELDTNAAAAVAGLQTQLDNAIAKTSATGVSAVVIDTVLVNDVRVVQWLLSIYDTVSGDVFSSTISASHNGTSVIDATTRKWNSESEFEMGNEIAGLTLDVVLAGAGAAQSLDLTIGATNACDIRATRISA